MVCMQLSVTFLMITASKTTVLAPVVIPLIDFFSDLVPIFWIVGFLMRLFSVFTVITCLTQCDRICCGKITTAVARNNVVNSQIFIETAVLTLVIIFIYYLTFYDV